MVTVVTEIPQPSPMVEPVVLVVMPAPALAVTAEAAAMVAMVELKPLLAAMAEPVVLEQPMDQQAMEKLVLAAMVARVPPVTMQRLALAEPMVWMVVMVALVALVQMELSAAMAAPVVLRTPLSA